jgi:hypothetical protein
VLGTDTLIGCLKKVSGTDGEAAEERGASLLCCGWLVLALMVWWLMGIRQGVSPISQQGEFGVPWVFGLTLMPPHQLPLWNQFRSGTDTTASTGVCLLHSGLGGHNVQNLLPYRKYNNP